MATKRLSDDADVRNKNKGNNTRLQMESSGTVDLGRMKTPADATQS